GVGASVGDGVPSTFSSASSIVCCVLAICGLLQNATVDVIHDDLAGVGADCGPLPPRVSAEIGVFLVRHAELHRPLPPDALVPHMVAARSASTSSVYASSDSATRLAASA